MFDEFLYERLHQLRVKKRVSAREMSLALGQSEGYINNIENKHSLPSMAVFFYICEYFNITPNEFFDEDNAQPEQLRELVQDLKKLNEEQIKNISAIVKGLIS